MTHRFDPTSLREYDIRGIVGKTLGPADAMRSAVASPRACAVPAARAWRSAVTAASPRPSWRQR